MSMPGTHGPSQLLRAAICPSWLLRQSLIRPGALAKSCFMGPASALSSVPATDAGLNTNARSLREPSPLMSWLTSGENGVPDVTLAIDVISSDGTIGHEIVAMNWCVRWRSLVPHPD